MRYIDRNLNPDHTPLAWLTTHLTGAHQFHAHVGYLDRPGAQGYGDGSYSEAECARMLAEFEDGDLEVSQRNWVRIEFADDPVVEDELGEPCQPIGCDAGRHLPGCTYAEVDGD